MTKEEHINVDKVLTAALPKRSLDEVLDANLKEKLVLQGARLSLHLMRPNLLGEHDGAPIDSALETLNKFVSYIGKQDGVTKPWTHAINMCNCVKDLHADIASYEKLGEDDKARVFVDHEKEQLHHVKSLLASQTRLKGLVDHAGKVGFFSHMALYEDGLTKVATVIFLVADACCDKVIGAVDKVLAEEIGAGRPSLSDGCRGGTKVEEHWCDGLKENCTFQALIKKAEATVCSHKVGEFDGKIVALENVMEACDIMHELLSRKPDAEWQSRVNRVAEQARAVRMEVKAVLLIKSMPEKRKLVPKLLRLEADHRAVVKKGLVCAVVSRFIEAEKAMDGWVP